MKFQMIVTFRDGSSEPWEEKYDERKVTTIEEAEEFGRATIDWFNNTLSQHEKPREFVSVIFVSDETDEHDWFKTNAASLSGRSGGIYDTHECADCGITGKRWGLSGSIDRDRKFKAAGYASCSQAKILRARYNK